MNTTSLPKHPLLNPPPLVGLVGKARSGKDTAVQIAQALVPGKIYRVAFADALKRQVALAAGTDVATVEDRKSVFRATLQAYGVLMREFRGPNYWIDQTRGSIDSYRAVGKAVFVPDCRFLNEAAFLRSKGGLIVRVIRPHFSSDVPAHVSETEQDAIQADYTLEACTLQELHPQVVDLVRKLDLA